MIHRLLSAPLHDLLAGRLAPRVRAETLLRDAGLPAALAELARVVLRRARLWRTEEIDVARELIAHFRDGLEAGATPAHLRDTFGDPRRVARLIARAKRRNRPLWWRTLDKFGRGLLILFGLCVVLYVVQAIRLYSGEVRIKHNYLAEWNAAALAVPPDQRAWPLYVEAALAVEECPAPRASAVTPSQPDWPALAEWAGRSSTGS